MGYWDMKQVESFFFSAGGEPALRVVRKPNKRDGAKAVSPAAIALLIRSR